MDRPSPLYIAFQRVEYRRNTKTFVRSTVLSDDPGPAHALDVKSTREGDPWRKYGVGARAWDTGPRFYDHDGPKAACGARVKVVLPMEVDAEDPDVCPECAELVRTGKAVGRWGGGYIGPSRCCTFLRFIESGDEISHHDCILREHHEGPHNDVMGATWQAGVDDFTPAPDGYV